MNMRYSSGKKVENCSFARSTRSTIMKFVMRFHLAPVRVSDLTSLLRQTKKSMGIYISVSTS